MIIYLLHGFNVPDQGKNSTDRLIEPLTNAGHRVIDLDYGWWGRARVRLCNQPLANVIAKTVEPGSVIIGHSNGACIAHLAALAGAPASRLVLINPALNHDVDLAPQIDWVDVYHSPSDWVVRASAFIPFSPWGKMGRVGYRGTSSRFTNHNLETITGQKIGHSDVFTQPAFYDHLVAQLVAVSSGETH